MADEKYTPIKKHAFPAGECGGEIRITIPVFASKEDVESAMEAMQIIADRWKEAKQTRAHGLNTLRIKQVN